MSFMTFQIEINKEELSDWASSMFVSHTAICWIRESPPRIKNLLGTKAIGLSIELKSTKCRLSLSILI